MTMQDAMLLASHVESMCQGVTVVAIGRFVPTSMISGQGWKVSVMDESSGKVAVMASDTELSEWIKSRPEPEKQEGCLF